MNYKEFRVSLPIKDNNVKVVEGIVQGDTANIIHVRLMDGTEPFDFTGYTEVLLDILKPDGTNVQLLVTDDPQLNAENPYWLHVSEPSEGRVSFIIQGQAALLPGQHFAHISVLGDGKILTSARLNYYVGSRLSDGSGVESSNEYASLLTLLNRNSAIAQAERDREDAETERNEAEVIRETRMDEKIAEVAAYIANAAAIVAQTESHMEAAELYAQLAQNPSAEIMQQLISGFDLASETYVNNSVATAVRNFDAGAYTDTGNAVKLLKVRRGNKAQEISLAEGELGFSRDSKQAYIGSTSGNIPLNGVYVASAVAPTEHHVLWIDTSASGGGAIKYYDGSVWQPTATASFA